MELTCAPSLRFCRERGRRLRVNIISESTFLGLTGQGEHTGFLECIELMRLHPDLQVAVNSRDRCDVLHAHSYGPYYIYQGMRHRGRRIFTAHVIPESAEGALPFMGPVTRAMVRRYLKWIYDFSDAVIAVAPETAASIRRLGVRSPVHVVRNAIRTERFFPSADLRIQGRALLGLDREAAVVLGVGQIQPRKGISDFAEVARALPDIRFVWVGGRPFGLVSAGVRALNRLVATAPPNLRFTGMIDPDCMPKIYNAADLMLFPSHQENCPYAPIEAAACLLPVVFRRLAAYDSLYGTEYCAANDVTGMIALVRDLLEDSDSRRRALDTSRRLTQMFTAEAYVRATADLYDHVALRASH
jgi:1,2-diacylglycerol-3-alpha-glucose alpha-1,2-galactosyltransferase